MAYAGLICTIRASKVKPRYLRLLLREVIKCEIDSAAASRSGL